MICDCIFTFTFFSPPCYFDPCCHAGMMSHPPIPINELAEHIELLKANDNLRLSQEYEVKIYYYEMLCLRFIKSYLTFASLCADDTFMIYSALQFIFVTCLHYGALSFHYLQMHY